MADLICLLIVLSHPFWILITMFQQVQPFRRPRLPELKAWCSGSFGEKTRPCSSKAEHSPCKREVAGALPRLGLHFSPIQKFAHVVYWMGTVLLKRLKQVRFLPCVSFVQGDFFRSLVQLVRILTLNQRDPSSILGRSIVVLPLIAQWRCSSFTQRWFYVQVVVRGLMRYSSVVERSPVKRMIPGSIPGNAAIFHCRLIARLPAHNWNNVGANPASGIFQKKVIAQFRCPVIC